MLFRPNYPAGHELMTTQEVPERNFEPEQEAHVEAAPRQVWHGDVQLEHAGATWTFPGAQVWQLVGFVVQVAHFELHWAQAAPASYHPFPQGFAHEFPFFLNPAEHVWHPAAVQAEQPFGQV